MYFLSRDAYVCAAGGYWIILDAERDRYLCLAEQPLRRAARCLHGWTPAGEAGLSREPHSSAADDLVQSLLSRGVLTDNPEKGKAFSGTCFEPPTRELPRARSSPRRADLLRSFPGFVRASAIADARLHLGSLLSTIQAVERRRLRYASRAAPVDDDRTAALLSVFRALRPLYPRRGICLFDSLALWEFLAPHRLLPHWVFGVIGDPFSAHCWLQMGSVVINDELERVRRYTPIMAK